MAQVVGVHGIWQHQRGSNELRAEWEPPLRDGLKKVGAELEPTLELVFYGDLFRKPDQTLGAERSRELSPWERDLARAYVQGAIDAGERIPPLPDEGLETLGPGQDLLLLLMRSKRFVKLLEAPVFAKDPAGLHLSQVYRYLHEPELRDAARQRVRDAIGDDTRVVLGHSLGSVVAYEALCSLSSERTKNLHFVTMGSPLGIPNLIFDRLRPSPQELLGHTGGRSPGVASWTNLSAPNDPVALVKELKRPLFDFDVHDVLVDNGYLRDNPHSIGAYLNTETTGHVVAQALP